MNDKWPQPPYSTATFTSRAGLRWPQTLCSPTAFQTGPTATHVSAPPSHPHPHRPARTGPGFPTPHLSVCRAPRGIAPQRKKTATLSSFSLNPLRKRGKPRLGARLGGRWRRERRGCRNSMCLQPLAHPRKGGIFRARSNKKAQKGLAPEKMGTRGRDDEPARAMRWGRSARGFGRGGREELWVRFRASKETLDPRRRP